MQTFLPFRSFVDTARVLDMNRLGNQRNEAWVVLNIITGVTPNSRWRNHTTVRMWRGYELHLCLYGMTICEEWFNRGYTDTMWKRFHERYKKLREKELQDPPPWLGREDLHSTHRAALLAKNPEWYSRFGWKEEPCIAYVWPA